MRFPFSVLKDRRGTAAVEFALIFAFFLLPLFIGLIEMNSIYRAQAKLNAFVNDLAMMVSIQGAGGTASGVYSVNATGSVTNSLQDICSGAAAAVAPYPANGLTVQIASVTMEASQNGLPNPNTSTSFVYHNSATPLYDQWEQDFAVSGRSCTSSMVNNIGVSGSPSPAVNLLTSNPPASGNGSGGLVQYPCDNGIVVKAQMTYPGMLGLFIPKAVTLTQSAYVRWRYATILSEVQCAGCSTANVKNNSTVLYGSTKQACNTSNTTAQN